MASPNISFLEKNIRWAMAAQTSLSAPEATTAAQVRLLPAQNDYSIAYDRGTGVISRAAVMDGYPGEICSTPGSRGATITLTNELHDTVGNAGVVTNYVAQTLLASGFEATGNGTSLVEFRPSHRTPAAVTAAVIPVSSGSTVPPTVATLYRYQTTTNTGFPFMNVFTGCTANTTFDLTTGEIAKMTSTYVATIDSSGDWQTATGVSSLPTTFSGSDVTCKPYTVRSATFTLNDSALDQSANVINMPSVQIDYKGSPVESLDPTQTYGFGISPIVFNEAPEIVFTMGLDGVNMGDQDFIGFLQAFRDGDEGSLEIELDTGDSSGNRIVFSFPTIQYTGYVPTNQNGAMSAQITAKCVRSPGSSLGPVIYYYYDS